MDLFEAFPSLKDTKHPALDKKILRLISVSGLIYDDEALYFEISPEKYWGRLPEGKSAIGIGLPKIKPDGTPPLYQALMQHLRRNWRCDTNLYPSGYAFLMDDKGSISLLSGSDIPFIMQMTHPRLGGANVPNALVQAVFLLPVRRFNWQNAINRVDLLKITRPGFDAFLAQASWSVKEIISQPWSDFKVKKPLPGDAVVRSVLTLRSIRELLLTDTINLDLLRGSHPN